MIVGVAAAFLAVQHRTDHRTAPIQPSPEHSRRITPSGAPSPAAEQKQWMFTFEVSAETPTAQSSPALISFCTQPRSGDGYVLALWAARAELRKRAHGKLQVLANRVFAGHEPGFRGDVAIQRKSGGIVVAWAHKLLLRSDDVQFSSKDVSVQQQGSAFRVTLTRVQPLGDIYFADDFMRAQTSGQWRPTSGNWHLSALQIGERSANPFCLYAKFHGSPRFSPLFEGRTRRYVGIGIRTERRSGRETVLYVFENLPAWKAGMRMGDEIVSVDGTPISDMSEQDMLRRIRGQAGAPLRLGIRRQAEGGEKELALVVQRQLVDLDQIEETLPLSQAPMTDSTSILAGYRFWSDYIFSAAAKCLGQGEFGLIFYRQDEQNYYLFKWAERGLALTKVTEGHALTLAEHRGAFAPGQYYRLEVSVRGASIAASVDGVVVCTARDEELLWGEVGLYAAKSLGVHFDDVKVTDAGLRDPPSDGAPAARLGELFTTDEYMKEWAARETEWTEAQPQGAASLERRAVTMRWNRFPFPQDPGLKVGNFLADRLILVLGAAQRDRTSGYALDIERSRRAATVTRAGVPLGKPVRVPESWTSAALSIAKGKLVAAIEGRTILEFQDSDALNGGVVGLGGDVGGIDFEHVTVGSASVLDEDFTKAPVNWEIAGGVWGVMNRWVCDPRWSWFGGRSDSLAAIWSKSAFAGDVTFDLFAAMEMPSYWKSPHEKSSDLAVTICGDGRNLATGYTVIFGAAMNTCTRLYRRDRMVAETRSPLILFARREIGEEEGLELHRNWFHLRLQKEGGRIRFFLGDVLGLEYEDPSPLPGGRVAVWTVQNGVLIARARVAAADRTPPVLVLGGAGEFADEALRNTGGAEITAAIRPDGLADAEGTYAVTNMRSGGTFAVFPRQNSAWLASANPSGGRVPGTSVSFDYSLPAGVKIDLYFDYEGNKHRVVLTGPPETDDFSAWLAADVCRVPGTRAVTVGRFANVQADGRWQHAEFRLLDAMRDLYPDRSAFTISNIALANYSNAEYLFAGFGGNHKGTSYQLRNFRFLASAKTDADATLVRSVEFPFETPHNTSAVVWRVNVAAGQNPDFEKLSAEVNGRRFNAGDPPLRFRRVEGSVELDLARAGLVLNDGDVVEATLLMNGNAVSTRSWEYRREKDRFGPESIRIFFGRADLFHNDFEQGLGECYPVGTDSYTMPIPAGGWLRRELRAKAGTGQEENYCLRVQNKRMAHDFGVGFLPCVCDVGRFPVLSFDYRLHQGVSVDISFIQYQDSQGPAVNRTVLQWATQSFRRDLRSYSSFETIGVLSKPVQDGNWHRADINLLKKLKAADSTRREYLLGNIHIADDVCGYLGNYEGASFWIDNIRLRPVLRRADVQARWTALDISGITDYLCAFNPDPTYVPEGKVTAQDIEALQDGATFFHLMVRDGAGNWSAPAHELVYLDVSPPEVIYFAPVHDLPGTFDIRFVEVGGLDPRTIVLKVGDQDYRVDGKRLWYDQETQRLTWTAGEELPLLQLRGRVEVVLEAASDFAGNAASTPQRWTWEIPPPSATPPMPPKPMAPRAPAIPK